MQGFVQCRIGDGWDGMGRPNEAQKMGVDPNPATPIPAKKHWPRGTETHSTLPVLDAPSLGRGGDVGTGHGWEITPTPMSTPFLTEWTR